MLFIQILNFKLSDLSFSYSLKFLFLIILSKKLITCISITNMFYENAGSFSPILQCFDVYSTNAVVFVLARMRNNIPFWHTNPWSTRTMRRRH